MKKTSVIVAILLTMIILLSACSDADKIETVNFIKSEGIGSEAGKLFFESGEWQGELANKRIEINTVTDPEDIARHKISMSLFSDVLGATILDVPAHEEGVLPPYITAEIVSVVLFEGIPEEMPNEGRGNVNYSSGSLMGLYSGPTTFIRSVSEDIGDGWWAVALWFQGTLDLHISELW